ncbi:hypothetical protein B0H17DRAFT_1202882 [Mycena rosella]|uniref:Uncharacterized protein n=1 Tax=Mycena rosella TaxID=1033263 RepID=A0AAD7DDC3_MYCRO|nr:hypothetical protein B0H17DRAFT_1202882 [Mycena rosella]
MSLNPQALAHRRAVDDVLDFLILQSTVLPAFPAPPTVLRLGCGQVSVKEEENMKGILLLEGAALLRAMLGDHLPLLFSDQTPGLATSVRDVLVSERVNSAVANYFGWQCPSRGIPREQLLWLMIHYCDIFTMEELGPALYPTWAGEVIQTKNLVTKLGNAERHHPADVDMESYLVRGKFSQNLDDKWLDRFPVAQRIFDGSKASVSASDSSRQSHLHHEQPRRILSLLLIMSDRDQLNHKYKQHLLRTISLPSFAFFPEPLDSYWRTRATSGMSRELIKFTGDGYLIRCGIAHLLVSNLCFCSILVCTGVIKFAVTNSTELKSVADTFEAYVGAYFRQRGEEQLNLWICANFGPLAESLVPECYEEYRRHHAIGKPPKRAREDAGNKAPELKRKHCAFSSPQPTLQILIHCTVSVFTDRTNTYTLRSSNSSYL